MRKLIYSITARYWHRKEIDQVRELLCSSAPIDKAALFDAHIPVSAYQHEVAFFQSQPIKSILHIGSGAFPASALVLKDSLQGVRITCLDRCETSCELSQELVSRLGYNVQIMHGDISSVKDFRDYDCLLFSLNVLEQEAIFENISAKIDNPTLIVMRSAMGWASLIYPKNSHPKADIVKIPDNQKASTRAALRYFWVG